MIGLLYVDAMDNDPLKVKPSFVAFETYHAFSFKKSIKISEVIQALFEFLLLHGNFFTFLKHRNFLDFS